MAKEWKTIQLEDNYEVSSTGEVRNIKTKHIKSTRKNKGGYCRVTLYPSGKTYTIHQLVATAFLTRKPEHTQVNHINGDKCDNSVENLEWCTSSHNSRHRDTVLVSKWKGQLNPAAKLLPDIVRKIKYSPFPGLTNKQIGDLFGTSDEQVRRIRSGQRWKHI